MIQIKMIGRDKGELSLKLAKGKKWTITEDNMKTWDKVEVMEV